MDNAIGLELGLVYFSSRKHTPQRNTGIFSFRLSSIFWHAFAFLPTELQCIQYNAAESDDDGDDCVHNKTGKMDILYFLERNK